jgi:uncharacterized protein (TIGR03067 family)
MGAGDRFFYRGRREGRVRRGKTTYRPLETPMYGMILCAMLIAPQQETPTPTAVSPDRDAPAISLDGNWTVLCVEKNGQPVLDAKNKTVNINNNTVTCKSDPKHEFKTMRLEFGPQAMIRVTEFNEHGNPEKARTGVYILTKDFMSICLHDDAAMANARQIDGERTSLKIDFTGKPIAKSHCTIVLKRADHSER